ncbi:hypothetical protein B0O80DRAFT_461539 [Mortierella sp. GBAus27b]|nr:hypothetical protein B0O80DRAFT_461539 [Mortierella sp. GBAus27b]
MQLDFVYQAFETIQSVYGLDIDLTVDMESISTGNTSDHIQRHDAIFNIMRHPCAHSVIITRAPSDFTQHSSLGSRTDVFPGLKHVSLDLSTGLEQDIFGLKTLAARMPNLRSFALRDSCGGSGTASALKQLFEVDDNRVKIHVWSRLQAELVSYMLTGLQSISGLGINLCVELNDGDISDRSRGHDSVFDIMRHSSTHSVALVRPSGDLIQQFSALSRNDQFLHLKRLDIDLCMLKEDLSGIKALLSRVPDLACLKLNDSEDSNTLIQVGFCSVDPLDEPIDGNIDGAKIHLGSSALMELTNELLSRSKGAHKIDTRLYWRADQSDFDRLRDGLTNTRVNGMKLHVDRNDGLKNDESALIQYSDGLFDIMGHPSIDSVTVMKPPTILTPQFGQIFRRDEFSNLKNLDISLSSIKDDISTLEYLNYTAKITGLTFQGYVDDLLLIGLYHSIAEHQRYPIIFIFRKRRIPPSTASHQSVSGHQYLSHLPSLVSIQMDQLRLNGKAEEEAAVDILVKLERGAAGLKKLSLSGSFEERGDQFLKKVASVISRHEVRKLEVNLNETKGGGMRVLSAFEGDQWKYINHLEIAVSEESVGAGAMKAVVEGRDKVHGPLELDYFYFMFPSTPKLSGELLTLVRSFVASTSMKSLDLYVRMTPTDMGSVLSSMEASRLEEMKLLPDQYSTSQVDSLLDCLTNAHSLRRLYLDSYIPTQGQKKRMQARGVDLRRN